MASVEEQLAQLQRAAEAQEQLRPSLGDATVEVTLTAIRARMDVLRRPVPPPDPLRRLQGLLPPGLAAKMRAAGPVEGERKQVTVLFADISGFTSIGERLDVEELATFVDEAVQLLAGAVFEHEGYLDKFIGDAVMAVFGAPLSHEDDPERALHAALGMRERLSALTPRWSGRLGVPLTLHMGVNTGTVVAGPVGGDLRMPYSVLGDTVNTASRLQSAASPGQIFVSRETWRLAEHAFDFRALEPIRVKGKREPLHLYELVRALPRPRRHQRVAGFAPSFVGREAELAALDGMLVRLRGGRGQVVGLFGEAGLGKSRLLEALRLQAADLGWAEGRSFPHTTSLAFGPFLDLVRRVAGITDEDSEAEARARLNRVFELRFSSELRSHAVLAHFFGVRLLEPEAAALAEIPTFQLRQRLFDLIGEWLGMVTAERPLLLVLEDLHWADAASLELLAHLLPLTERMPLALIVTCRSDSRERTAWMARTAMERGASFSAVPLAPLSARASLTMAQELLSLSPIPEALARVLERAEGNPFFVEEVIRSLVEREGLVRGAGGWTVTPKLATLSVPDTLKGLLTSRLDQLPEDARRVARHASVAGRSFSARLLRGLMEDAAGLDASLAHLLREEILVERASWPEVEYAFKHALTQEAAYEGLLGPRRKELHRRTGEVLEAMYAGRLGESSSILGAHFLEGEAFEKAAHYLLQAGAVAQKLHARTEACSLYAKALEALEHLPDTPENQARRAEALIQLDDVSYLSDSIELSLARLERAAALVRTLDGSRARRLLGQAEVGLGRMHAVRNHHHLALVHLERVFELAQELGDEELLAISSTSMGLIATMQGRFHVGVELCQHGILPLQKLGKLQNQVIAEVYLAVALASRGEPLAGESYALHALARSREERFVTGIAQAETMVALVNLIGGKLETAIEAGHRGIAVAEQCGDSLRVCLGLWVVAWAEQRLGRGDDAALHRERARSLRIGSGQGPFFGDWLLAAEAEAALGQEGPEVALARADLTIEAAKASGGIFSEGLARCVRGRALAALGRAPDAEFTESLRLLDSGQAVLEAARVRLAWARACRDSGRDGEARRLAGEALARFEASGLVAEAGLARVLFSA